MNTYSPDIETLRKFIVAERAMRLWVFKDNAAKLATKTAEADMAIKALDRLAGRLQKLERAAEQRELFSQEDPA